MAEYIKRDVFINNKLIPLVKQLDLLHPKQKKGVLMAIRELNNEPTADVVEVKHGEWNLEVHSFYADNWDESIELCVYILASCSNCGEEHKPKQVFSKHLYAPEDADDDFRFDQEYEKSKALEEFKQSGYKFKNYCPNCGAKMDKRSDTE